MVAKVYGNSSEDSPRRRSLMFSQRKSTVPNCDEVQNDDEAERAALLAEDKSVISQFSTPVNRKSTCSSSSINSQQKEHFQGCLKLFAENKINKDNAWNLQLIDFMSTMLRKHDSRMEDLSVASTTLDASTRIYSFRVDAVHHDVLKMAGGLTKVTQNKRGKKPDGEDDDNNGENSADGEGNTQKRKEKRKKTAKSSLSTNVESQLNAEIELNECIDPFFAQLAATTGDMTSSNRAFNATLPIDDINLGLVLRSDVPFLDYSKENEEKKLDIKNLRMFEVKKKIVPLVKESDQICITFHGFSIVGWDPENEELKMKETNRWLENNLNLSQQAMAFDLNAEVEPLPLNDITNGFPFDDDAHNGVESDEEELGVMTHAYKKEKTRSVTQLVDMRPSALSDGFLEYSYSSAVIRSWAGPAHWKLKNNVNRFSRTAEKSQTLFEIAEKAKKTTSRKKKPLDFLGEGMGFSISLTECPEYSSIVPAKIMIGRKTLSQGTAWSEKKFKTPIDRGFNHLHFKKFYLKQSVMLKTVSEEITPEEQDVTHRFSDINNYDYNNENDNSYCPNSQPNDDDGGGWVGEDVNEAGDVHRQITLIDNNTDMVEPPAKVAKIFIPYAMRAKKVDMKQLKTVTWRMLTISDVDKGDKENEPATDVEVKKTTFTSLYKNLPCKLSTNMKEALSVSLSLLAVLHLANEKGLHLEKGSDLSDFFISKEIF